MENQSNENPEHTEEDDGLCVNCRTKSPSEEGPTRLCSECRTAFIKYPVPKWILTFAIGILVLMAASMSRMPRFFTAAVNMARAEKAMEEKKYLTAQRQLKLVLNSFPDYLPANGKLIIVAAANLDLVTMNESYLRIAEEKIEDMELLGQINQALSTAYSYYMVDSTLQQKLDSVKNEDLEVFLDREVIDSSDMLLAGYLIADRLYDIKNYPGSEKILQRVLNRDPDYSPALTLMAAVKRNIGDFEGALKCCQNLLKKNIENVAVIAQKARIELKRKNDVAAKRLAGEAMKLDSKNILALEAQAMVDFFSGRERECTKLLALIRQYESKEGNNQVSDRLTAIIKGVEIYR